MLLEMLGNARGEGKCRIIRSLTFPKCMGHRLQFDDLDMNDELGALV